MASCRGKPQVGRHRVGGAVAWATVDCRACADRVRGPLRTPTRWIPSSTRPVTFVKDVPIPHRSPRRSRLPGRSWVREWLPVDRFEEV